MAQLLTIVVVLGALALIVTRMRARRIHFRVSEWPIGKQIEAGLAVIFAIAAALGALAGEYGFASWLAVMAAVIAAFCVLTWPGDR